MVVESRDGQITLFILANGVIIELMAKENLCMLTVMFTKVSGLTIKPMAQAATSMRMEPCMKVSGKMIYSTVKA
jgi:hypothetical protein